MKDNIKAKIKMTLKVILVICLLIYFNTSSLLAEDITEGANWASDAMARWQDYGILNGTSYGVLAPGEELTKVEAITILNRINNVDIESNKDESKFKDVETFRWYYNEIEKAVATGLISGDSEGNINPKDLLTREIAFNMVAKLFDISYQGSDARSYLAESVPYDYEEIGLWCSSSVAGLIELGYIDGYLDGSIKPKKNITRGEFITLLDNIVDVMIMEKGEYDLYDIDGNIVINSTDVFLDNVSNDATLYLMAGSNEEVVYDDENSEALVINCGMVRSNIDYAKYMADDNDMLRKKLVELKVLSNMPTAEDLTGEILRTYGARVRGTDKWNDIILKVSKEEEIDPVFVKVIMAIESAGEAGTKSKQNTNGTYDYGLMQVNSSWSSSFDLNRMLTDNEYAIRCGIKVIKRKIEASERSGKGGTVFDVAWRYNGYNNQGHRYAEKFAAIYENLSGMSSEQPVRVVFGEDYNAYDIDKLDSNNLFNDNKEKEKENKEVKEETKEAKETKTETKTNEETNENKSNNIDVIEDESNEVISSASESSKIDLDAEATN
ncbi:MAG: S-layer homology domain-containing protein [Clostridia bacterium]|nr:S-layer homology domain-containing protein [Clostridia bacterium]